MRFLLLLFFLLSYTQSEAQEFTLADTLRGANSAQRTCYDVTHYNLDVTVDVGLKSISGFNEIRFKVMSDFDSLQIDLFENMTLDSILFRGEKLDFIRHYNAVFVRFETFKSKEKPVKSKSTIKERQLLLKTHLGMVVLCGKKMEMVDHLLVWLAKERVQVSGGQIKTTFLTSQIVCELLVRFQKG